MAITTIGGNINSTAVLANLDYKYGPYNSLQEAYDTLGPNGVDKLAIGLTVGIIEDGRIREYWFKSGTDSVNNLVLKSEGKSAYDIAVEEGFEGTEQEWIDSLKGEPGDPGQNAVNPFKGYFNELSELINKYPVGKTGDYANVFDPTDDKTYRYIWDSSLATPTWVQALDSSSQPIEVTPTTATFYTGESVVDVKIINDILVGGTDDVLSAEAGKNVYLNTVFLDTETIDFSAYQKMDGYIYRTDEIWIDNSHLQRYIQSYIIPVTDLEAQYVVLTANENGSSIAWLTSNNLVHNQAVPFVDGTTVEVLSAGVEKKLVKPDTAQYLYVLSNSQQSSYLPTINKYEEETIKVRQEALEVRQEALEDGLENDVELDWTRYPESIGTIVSNNKFYKNTNYHRLVPVSDLGTNVVISGSENNSVIAWLTSDELINEQTAPFSSQYQGRIVIDYEQSVSYQVPDDAEYLYVLSKDTNNNVYLPNISFKESKFIGIDRDLDDIDTRLDALEEGGQTSADIVAMNNRSIVLNMFKNTKKTMLVFNGGYRNNRTLNLIHFSDLHGNSNNLGRLIKFRKEFDDYIDGAICTGDIIRNVFDDDFMFWLNNDDASDILLTTGNHEYYNGEQVASEYLQQITNLQVYNKFFAPLISNWDVVQPANAEEKGLNYYYKDYAAKKVRLIALDNFRIDQTQEQFVYDALAGARANNYHVVMATHYGKYNTTNIECGFNSNYPWGNTWKPDGIDEQLDNIVTAIDNFVAQGGKFVCWLCGHTHVDFFGTILNHPNQLQINISCASDGIGSNYPDLVLYCDQDRTVGTKGQDLFNIVSIDTTMGYLRLYRIGASIDINCRSRQSLVYDYLNQTLISQR